MKNDFKRSDLKELKGKDFPFNWWLGIINDKQERIYCIHLNGLKSSVINSKTGLFLDCTAGTRNGWPYYIRDFIYRIHEEQIKNNKDMNNSKGQPIKDGDILAESKATPLDERIIVLEDLKYNRLYWRLLMGDITIRNDMKDLEGERYLTLENIFTS